MDSRRAETFEALSAYLEQQRTFLARTQADIDRLKELKAEALASPEQLANRSNLQGNETPIPQLLSAGEKISRLQDYHPALSFPAKIDWEVFSSSDATPLRSLAVRTRIDHTQRTVPSNHQRSPLSFLQKFVKDARKIILDPVFEDLSTSTDIIALTYPTDPFNSNHTCPLNGNNPIPVPTPALPPSLSEDEGEDHPQAPVVQESMTAQRKRERARAKVRELKKRKIRSDLVVGCKLGEHDSDGVFVRHDVEDESVEVDVSMETPKSSSIPLDGPSEQASEAMDVDASKTVIPPQCAKPASLSRAPQRTLPRVDGINRSARTRKPSLKLQAQTPISNPEQHTELSVTPPTLMSPQTPGKRSHDAAPKTEPLSMSAEANAEADKIRSETYKQAWSISEQHLLERLLEEIPDGERNRWAKISQAMGGRRTPRQVASRVQKYFEKLKRFGVGVDKKGKTK